MPNNPFSDLPEVDARSYQYPEVVQQEQESLIYLHNYTPSQDPRGLEKPSNQLIDLDPDPPSWQTTAPPPKARLCGLKRRTFWLLLLGIALILITVGAVAGGLGGSLSHQSKSTSTTTSSNSLPSTSTSIPSRAPSSTISTPPTTTIELVEPTATLYRTCPSVNNTLYTTTNANTSFPFTFSFRQICDAAYNNTRGLDAVNSPTASLADCIELCIAYDVANAAAIRATATQACNAVCWRNSEVGGNFEGQCFGFTTVNSSTTGGFVYGDAQANLNCDSAAWINQQAFLNEE